MKVVLDTPPVLWIGSIQATPSGFSTGSMSRFTTTASLSLRTSTQDSVSSERGVDLLVRHVGRHVDEVAGPRLGGELQLLAPAHPGAAADHVDHALQRPVVVGAGLGVGVDVHRAGPELLGAHPGAVDGGGAVHAGRLGGVRVQLVAGHDAHAGMLPAVGREIVAVVAVVRHGDRSSRSGHCAGRLLFRL